jgi:hypothetical protein
MASDYSLLWVIYSIRLPLLTELVFFEQRIRAYKKTFLNIFILPIKPMHVVFRFSPHRFAIVLVGHRALSDLVSGMVRDPRSNYGV